MPTIIAEGENYVVYEGVVGTEAQVLRLVRDYAERKGLDYYWASITDQSNDPKYWGDVVAVDAYGYVVTEILVTQTQNDNTDVGEYVHEHYNREGEYYGNPSR